LDTNFSCYYGWDLYWKPGLALPHCNFYCKLELRSKPHTCLLIISHCIKAVCSSNLLDLSSYNFSGLPFNFIDFRTVNCVTYHFVAFQDIALQGFVLQTCLKPRQDSVFC
jgi:hypothetical protein